MSSQDNSKEPISCMPNECIPELKNTTPTLHTMVTTTQQPVISHVLDCKKYSGLSRLLRVSAYVLRAVRRVKGEHTSDSDSTWILSPSELSGAEQLWIAYAQSTLTTNRNFPS